MAKKNKQTVAEFLISASTEQETPPTAKEERARLFATIVYPESAPEDWQDRLEALHIPALVSPLHEFDTTKDGEVKKPHWHVLWRTHGKQKMSQAQEIANLIGGAGAVERVHDYAAYARYLCHLDDKDKHQYSPADVREFGGEVWAECALSATEQADAALDEIEAYIDEHTIRSYSQLLRMVRAEHPEWLRHVRSHTYHLSELVKAISYECSRS